MFIVSKLGTLFLTSGKEMKLQKLLEAMTTQKEAAYLLFQQANTS